MEDLNFKPAAFAVFKHSKGKAVRIGGYLTEADARAGIVRHEEARADNLMGLIAPDTSEVAYSIWKADWSRV